MSKAQLIANTETQILKGESYLFDGLRSQLIKNGLAENDTMIKTIDILRNETYETYNAKKLELGERYIKKLRILSILSHFYECTKYNLSKLSLLLSTNSEDTLKLLIEASINKLISIKINEQANEIIIVKSKIRERETKPLIGSISNGKLFHIKQKNSRVEEDINKLIGIINPSKEEEFRTHVSSSFLERLLQSH